MEISFGEPSIWVRKDGRFGVALPYSYVENGQTIHKRPVTTRSTREAAREWLIRKQHELLEGEAPAPESRDTLKAHLEVWLQDSVEPRVSYNTLQKRIWAASNHIVPTLGKMKLSELGPREIERFYAKLSREGYALATRREVHVTLRMALEQALRWGLVRSNPCALVEAPKQSGLAKLADSRDYEEEEEIRALSAEQAERLFAYARETGSRWLNYYVAAVRTGLRPGEMLGLRWGDLNLDADPATLRVRRTLDTHGSPRFGPPKSEASRRTIALHYEAAEAFADQRTMLESESQKRGKRDLVFPSTRGTPMNSGNLRKRSLQADLKDTGLPVLTLHELRHTFASIALHEWRLPIAIVQKVMGHESIKMTMDLYGHLMPSAEADAIRSLNALYRGNSRPASSA